MSVINALLHASIHTTDEYTIVITSIDYQLEQGTFKVFNTLEQAQRWLHNTSMVQYPEWHKINCPTCCQPPLPGVP